ncbi:MAG: sugar ABC transporter permease [Lachnospiraceae bacterium]|nr:sugar ABC transporter permease [Lachnospiraceae bacterium]
MKKDVKTLLKDNTMLIVLVLVFIFFTITTKGMMFQPLQFNALITQNAYVFILACGMLMCMLTGGNIDLSCGSFVCLIGAIGGYLMIVRQMNTAVSVILLILVGIIYGCVLGFLIAYVDIPPWIATLAGYLAFRGLGTQILSSNSSTGSLAPFPDNFLTVFAGKVLSTKLGELNIPCIVVGVVASLIVLVLNFRTRASRVKKGYEADSFAWVLGKTVLLDAVIMLFAYKLAMAGGIPTVLIWVAIIVLLYSFITGKTTIGRHFYVVGGNREAARLSGIDTRRVMFLAYLNMAVITVITSFAVLSKVQAANSTLGTNYEMDAISACVVGGVSAYGGAGTVPGMLVGALLIGVINLGMSLMNIDANFQKVVKGIVLLGAVAFDILSKKKSK